MKNKLFKITFLLAIIFLIACSEKKVEKESIKESTPEAIENTTIKVVLASEVEWSYLNPKRKDKAPMAGTLWGDRNSNEPTGFLLKPKDGFSSPPHIHNVSYRGIVISGLIHNDDPEATDMWMSGGSFWTQPKGEIHITSAKGQNTIAYIEIEKGPYLVLPEEEHFDSGERPVNIDKTNIVWVNASELTWNEANGAKTAFLWKDDNRLNGTFIKLKAGFNGKIFSKGSSFGAVVIKGQPTYLGKEEKTLEIGSYFSSEGKSLHKITTQEEVILYVRTNNIYTIISSVK